MLKTLKQLGAKHKPVKLYKRKFLEMYEKTFESFRDKELKILEIGVGGFKNENKGGQSLRMWSDYFQNSHIVGLDINNKNLDLPSNVTFVHGSQVDHNILERIVKEYGPFDIVIDDGSHITKNTISTFNYLWESTSLFYNVS